ncbi:MAG: DUF4440 domain-containing protein [Anaerolineales bacterium]|nr:DUF4440 domain-containing protein [Anaerolineales bacterium]
MIDHAADWVAIEAALRRTEASENRKDMDALMAEITEDAVLHFCDQATIQGKPGWRESYQGFFKTGFVATRITTLGREIAASGDLAWEHGTFVSEFEKPPGRVLAEGKYLGVWKKVGGEWKTAAVCIT